MNLPQPSAFDHLLFDPTDGTIIREREGAGYGYWAGGHKVFFDEPTGEFILFYRLRAPLELGRGGHCAVARSTDGLNFQDAWTATKDQLLANSIEVGHCVRDPGSGEWRLYVSYEYAPGRFWRVDLLRGETIETLDIQARRTVLTPADFGLRVLKDPVVYLHNDSYEVFIAGPALNRAPPRPGEPLSVQPMDATYLATSDDGIYFSKLQPAMAPDGSNSWHGTRARLNSVLHVEGGTLGFYDGGRSAYDTYEEWTGLAWSDDGVSFRALDQDQPWIRSEWGCVRYLYAQPAGSDVLFYYEYTREDGSHDLRVARVAR